MRTRLLNLLALAGLLVGLATAPATASEPPQPMAAPAASTSAGPEGAGEPLSGVRAMTTGYYHSCALVAGGQVRCSGYGNYGQLGNDETNDYTTAVAVRNATNTGNLANVTQITAGNYHTCALLSNREVRCWGRNDRGQLGDGTTATERHVPVATKNPTGTGRLVDVVQITADADHTCALLANGQARCWGENDFAPLGDGTEGTDRPLPRPVRAPVGTGVLTGVSQIDTGYYATCARLTNGQARCWGYNADGELGNGTISANRRRPVVVRAVSGPGPLTGVRRVSIGGYHACATLTNGQARCWGYNGEGSLGDGTTTIRPRPVAVRPVTGPGPLVGVVTLDAAYDHSCAQLSNGQARCWGQNFYDQLGNGIEAGPDVRRPTPVRNTLNSNPLVGVRQLQATDYHTCVTLTNGQARCWGYDAYGALGNGSTSQSPLPVPFTM
jgi:alpha-tubulin suppressor-like RCC1 family protein